MRIFAKAKACCAIRHLKHFGKTGRERQIVKDSHHFMAPPRFLGRFCTTACPRRGLLASLALALALLALSHAPAAAQSTLYWAGGTSNIADGTAIPKKR
jgi:hypothetical protein